MTDKKDGLQILREPFPENQIGFLPKGSKAQMTCSNDEKRNCKICGGWHHPKLIHLSYVGHAALTDRLLDADLRWGWEPLAFTPEGLPLFDNDGGLWIKLTVCGLTRLGYGNAEKSQYKEIGSRIKEVIGDCLRNAAMRFGAALELWHKGELHQDDLPNHDKPEIKIIGQNKVKHINDLLEESKSNKEKFLKFLNIKSVDEMPEDKFKTAMAALQTKLKP